MRSSSRVLAAAGLLAASLIAAGGATLLWSSQKANAAYADAVQAGRGPIYIDAALGALAQEQLGVRGATSAFEANLSLFEADFPAESALAHKTSALNRWAVLHPNSSSIALVRSSLGALTRDLDAGEAAKVRDARRGASTGSASASSSPA